jgi:DNA-binding transcriptional MerR regulator
MFTIGQVAELSGVPEGTLRMWERRHGFPAPIRLPSGHRRYSERDVELVRRVAEGRAAGLTLSVAIDRSRRHRGEHAPASVFAALRRARPDLTPQTLAKPLMIALSHAIEDESLSRAERPVLFGAFQRERFYRDAEKRWRAFARQAELAIVFADFDRLRTPDGGPAEMPLERDTPLGREWAVICDAPGHAVCLVGWEPPHSGGATRVFEAIWSVEPDVVRAASRICAGLAAEQDPALLRPVLTHLEGEPEPAAADQLRLAAAVTSRTLTHLSPGARAAA